MAAAVRYPPERIVPAPVPPGPLKPARDRGIRRMHHSGDCNVGEIAELFSVSRLTVCRSLDRTADLPPLPADTRSGPGIAKDDQLLPGAQEAETADHVKLRPAETPLNA